MMVRLSRLARSFLEYATSVRTLRGVAIIGWVGCVIGLVTFIAGVNGPLNAQGEYVGGDFLTFYTVGRMVLEGKAGSLYDLREQLQTLRRIAGRPDFDRMQPYVNPPMLGLLSSPLALLPFPAAYAASVVLLALVFWAGLRWVRRVVPELASEWFVVVALSLLFFPFGRTITGGQNTAISFALIAALIVALRGGRQAWAGVALGLMCYKPHFVLILSLLLLSRRYWICLVVGGAVGFGQYLLGALFCGLRWPIEMLSCVKTYWPMECRHNGPFLVSWAGFWEYALGETLGMPLGYGLALATLIVVLWAWRRMDARAPSSGPLWGLAVCAVILVSPHTQWYDGGLVLLPVLLGLDHLRRQGLPIGLPLRAMLVAGFLLFPVYRLAPTLGWNPLILLPAGVLVWMVALTTRRFGDLHAAVVEAGHTASPHAVVRGPTI